MTNSRGVGRDNGDNKNVREGLIAAYSVLCLRHFFPAVSYEGWD